MKFVTPREPRNPRTRGRDLIEKERQLTPWEELESWREALKGDIMQEVRRSERGTWGYFSSGRNAYDLYPELQHDLRLGPDDWKELPNNLSSYFRGKERAVEIYEAVIHFFPHRRVQIGLSDQSFMRDVQYQPAENDREKIRLMQFLLWMDWRPEERSSFQGMLSSAEKPALEELRQERNIVRFVNDAAMILLSFSAHREELRGLLQTRWSEVQGEVEDLKFKGGEHIHHDLIRFLRNLRLVLADEVKVDKYGRLNIAISSKKLETPQPLPVRSGVE